MRIEEITIGKLAEFINSKRFLQSDILPITVHRALSQIKNPRADQNDVVLFIAYDETDQIVGYVGALPDFLNDHIKIAWNSCWYTDIKASRTIALPLFFAFIKRWQGKIVMQDLTDHTKQIVQNLSYFTFVRPVPGKRIFMRFYFRSLLEDRSTFFRKFRFALKVSDLIFNSLIVLNQCLWKWVHPMPVDTQVIEVADIDSQINDFIIAANKNELFRRGKVELDWITENPWVLKSMNKSQFDAKYYFSSTAKSFSYRKLKIMKGPEMISFMIFKERDHHFELPYFYCDNRYLLGTIRSLSFYLMNQKARSFAYYNSKLIDFQRGVKIPSYMKILLNRELVVSNELVPLINDSFEIQDGDGDTVFT